VELYLPSPNTSTWRGALSSTGTTLPYLFNPLFKLILRHCEFLKIYSVYSAALVHPVSAEENANVLHFAEIEVTFCPHYSDHKFMNFGDSL
jgi:hypothetical protein